MVAGLVVGSVVRSVFGSAAVWVADSETVTVAEWVVHSVPVSVAGWVVLLVVELVLDSGGMLVAV